jgi:hypothetical protein
MQFAVNCAYIFRLLYCTAACALVRVHFTKTGHTQRKLVARNRFHKTGKYGLIENVILLN